MRPLITLVAYSVIIFLAACSKSANGGANTPPKTHADSLNLLTAHQWVFYQDSTVNTNFAYPDGEVPLSGVLFGNPTDYWNFKANGSFLGIVSGSTLAENTYQFLTSSKLYIPTTPDAGPGTITTLNTNTLTFYMTATSATGGTFYQRIWLRK